MPEQLNSPLNIISIAVNKEFKIGNFHSMNKVVYQLPNFNQELNLPEWAIYHSIYYNKNFDKIDVQAQLGYDLSYTTSFNAFGFMPATGMYYLSENLKAGEYPIISAYLSLRVKTVLIFIKRENLNSLFLRSKYYFNVDAYPIGTSVFKFGVSWRFKD